MKLNFRRVTDKKENAPPYFAEPDKLNSRKRHTTDDKSAEAAVEDEPPLDEDTSLWSLIEILMRNPSRVLTALRGDYAESVVGKLMLISLVGQLLFGIAVAGFSGGGQFLWIPLKIMIASALIMLLCLPSLYVFANLSDLKVSFAMVRGVMLTMLTIISLLLGGFSPLVLIFGLSTRSVAFAGFLSLLFLIISTAFGLGVLRHLPKTFQQQVTISFNLHVWIIIFLLVVLQMPTMLRPFLNSREKPGRFAPKFFLEHWLETLGSGERKEGVVDLERLPSSKSAREKAVEDAAQAKNPS